MSTFDSELMKILTKHSLYELQIITIKSLIAKYAPKEKIYPDTFTFQSGVKAGWNAYRTELFNTLTIKEGI